LVVVVVVVLVFIGDVGCSLEPTDGRHTAEEVFLDN
jgi:hypothetical protein